MVILLRAPPYRVRYRRQQRRIEGSELAVPSDPAEALLSIHQSGGGPTQRHRTTAPALHPLRHALEGSLEVLDRVRRAERTVQRTLRAEGQQRERLVEALPQRGDSARVLGLDPSLDRFELLASVPLGVRRPRAAPRGADHGARPARQMVEAAAHLAELPALYQSPLRDRVSHP